MIGVLKSRRFAFAFLTGAVLALSTPAVFSADPALVGDWRSVSHEKGALPGLISFKQDGSALLHPVGFDPQPGTWRRVNGKPSTIAITLTGIGSTEVSFSLKRGTLTLTYDNGNSQSFEKVSATKNAH